MPSDTPPNEEQQEPVTEQQPATSLSPIEIQDVGFDLEAAALTKTQGRRLVGLSLACATLVGLSVLVLGGIDNRHAFVTAGTHMNRLHKTGYERFYNCMLIGMDQSQIESGEELEIQIGRRIQAFGQSYATLIRKCVPNLDTLERDLDTMAAPTSIKPQIHAMHESVSRTRHAVQGLLEYLDRDGDHYQPDDAAPYLLKLAKSYENYRETHLMFRNAIREAL